MKEKRAKGSREEDRKGGRRDKIQRGKKRELPKLQIKDWGGFCRGDEKEVKTKSVGG